MHNTRITLRLVAWLFVGLASFAAQGDVIQNEISAKLNGAISPSGTFEAALTVTATGEPSMPYRGALMKDSAVASPLLFGNFGRARSLKLSPQVSSTDGGPIQIGVRIHEEDFLLPIHRQVLIPLDLIPMVLPTSSAPAGAIRPGAPSRYSEEITLALPEAFVATGLKSVNEGRAFARYRSEAKMEGAQLIVSRELLLKPEGAAGASRAALDSFWEAVRKDQQKRFELIRTVRTDATKWIQSLEPSQALQYGVVAIQQHEYEAARQLLERGIRLRPNDRSAWNNLGRALAALGQFEEAQKAYERQIAINPRDQYSYNNLALTREKLGDWDGALANLRKQLEIHPGDSFATSNLPRALIYTRHWNEVEAAASKALEAQPNSASQKLYGAVGQVCSGKASDGRQAMETAIGPRAVAASMNDAAFYLAECGKETALAEQYIRRALDQMKAAGTPAAGRGMSREINHQSSLSTYLDTYGWLLFKEQKTEEAVTVLTAAATASPRGDVYAHLAQAEFGQGHVGEAALHWREATFLEPGRLAEVPPEAAAQMKSITPLSNDRIWFRVAGNFPSDAVAALQPGASAFFFVTADADGKVQSARELDSQDQIAKSVTPALRALQFPIVEAHGTKWPTAHLVKVVKERDGSVLAARSVLAEAVAIATDLAPAEFPLAAPAEPAIQPAATPLTNVDPKRYTRPSLLQKISPLYTDEARRARLAGVVELKVIVGTDGTAEDYQVMRSLGLGLDEQAILAVRQWRYSPGELDGKPVRVATTIQVNFQIADPGRAPIQWHLSRAEFRVPQGATRPVIVSVSEPRIRPQAGDAKATLSFEIDENGAPVNTRVDNSSSDDWAQDAAAALAKWRFSPATQDERAIPVSCTLDFVRGY